MRTQVMKAAFFACLAVNMQPSRRNLEKMIRRITGGEGFSSKEVADWLRVNAAIFFGKPTEPLQNRSKTTSAPPVKHDPSVAQNHDENRPRVRVVKELVKIIKNTIAAAAPPPQPAEAEKPKRQRSEPKGKRAPRVIKPLNDPDQPGWVIQLRRDVAELNDYTLNQLDVEQRFLLARYHAWRWANCTKDEQTNRKKATTIAAGIANLANHWHFGSVTPGEYVDEGEKVWNQRGCEPWYKPWDVTGRFPSVPPKAQVRQWQAA